jgi:hypothetical protein
MDFAARTNFHACVSAGRSLPTSGPAARVFEWSSFSVRNLDQSDGTRVVDGDEETPADVPNDIGL